MIGLGRSNLERAAWWPSAARRWRSVRSCRTAWVCSSCRPIPCAWTPCPCARARLGGRRGDRLRTRCDRTWGKTTCSSATTRRFPASSRPGSTRPSTPSATGCCRPCRNPSPAAPVDRVRDLRQPRRLRADAQPALHQAADRRRDNDLVGNRTKRIFGDRVGRSVGAHTDPFRLQVYRRDTGEIMFDLSVPILVNGRHWGGFRSATRSTDTAARPCGLIRAEAGVSPGLRPRRLRQTLRT